MNKNKRVAILTSGGDSPGMNAAIYGFANEALLNGYEPYVVFEGYQGLIENKIEKLELKFICQHINSSGTVLGSSRSLEFQNMPEKRQQAVDNLKAHNIDALVVIGGDGSYKGAELLMDLGVNIITAPGTIDNDVRSSSYTIGFFSALNSVVSDIEKIASTCRSHKAVALIEVMGRKCPDLSVYAAQITAADAVVTINNPWTIQDFIDLTIKAQKLNKREVIIVVSELIYGEKAGLGLPSLDEITAAITKATGKRAIKDVLGYTQRGATPTSFEIYQALHFGKTAVELIKSNQCGKAIGFNGTTYYNIPLKEANNLDPVDCRDQINWQNSLINLQIKK